VWAQCFSHVAANFDGNDCFFHVGAIDLNPKSKRWPSIVLSLCGPALDWRR